MLVDAGSNFFGNGLVFDAFKGQSSRSIFSALQYDAFSLAHHDFAAGPTADQRSDLFIAQHIGALRAHSTHMTPAVVTNMNITDNAHLSAAHVTPYTLVQLQHNYTIAVFACVDLSKLATSSLPGSNMAHTYTTRSCKHAVLSALAQLKRSTPSTHPKPLTVLVVSDLPVSAAEMRAHGTKTAAREAMVDEIAFELVDLDIVVINFPSPKREQLGAQPVINSASSTALMVPVGDNAFGRAVYDITATFDPTVRRLCFHDIQAV